MAACRLVSWCLTVFTLLFLFCYRITVATDEIEVCTSRFWFNYRHVANTLSVYRSVKRLGIPDSHIVLMLADDMACNHRNPKPATVFSHKNMELNVYGDDVEVDYRGYEVTVENFLRVLTGRFPPSTPRSKRLLSDDRSNILIYMTVPLISNSFCRYNELLFIIDTCQGASMYERFYSPNVMALASSQVGEDSLSHQPDLAIGVHLMDRYTFYLLEFLEDIHPASQANMNDLFKVCPKSLCVSTPGHRIDLFQRNPRSVLITDFFGSVRKVEITTEPVKLIPNISEKDEKLTEEVMLTEPQKYVEQMPVAEIIHQIYFGTFERYWIGKFHGVSRISPEVRISKPYQTILFGGSVYKNSYRRGLSRGE
ncbi:GPI-anchor transamidase [Acipenser ruthenus]|uniref:GPI-anchor transamidase n=1 Tax=Acipenser ruthenus TaxID=7906 RepID=A0A662YVN2_ACIRT|nr:GPI-anchor transamidase [Acipenser ruthenus]